MDKDEDRTREGAASGDSAEQGSDREQSSKPGRQGARSSSGEIANTGEVRIDAEEAAVVAGLEPPRPQEVETVAFLAELPSEPTEAYQLPDWSDPPTGQVPRILLENPDAPEHDEPMVRGPSWREEGSDWDDNLDLSVFSAAEEDLSQIAGVVAPPIEAPFEFAFAEVDDLEATPTETPWQPLLDEAASQNDRRRRAHRRRPQRAARPSSARPSSGRSGLVATATGVVIALLALACFALGPPAALALMAVVLLIGAGEAFGALQHDGYRPATLVGILAVPALVIGAYLRGPEAIVVIFGLSVLLSLLWYLPKSGSGELVSDLGASLLVLCWVGVLGSFVGLLLSPGAFPHRHGVAFVLAALILTATHDVGAYAIGSRFGRRALAPKISPGKTVEGLAGATVLVLAVALLGIAHLHPFHLASALELGVVVSVFAPLGDLVESLIKRDLSIKDMGSLLPAHGGVLDRIDAMLFVIVPTYFLVRLVHL